MIFPAAASASDVFASTDLRRRATGYGVAILLHAAALTALLILPPAVLNQAVRVGQAIDVRLYTVAGGADAETDAPLFEPPLARAQADPSDATGTGSESVEEAEIEAEPIEPVIEAEPTEPAVETPATAPDAVLTAPPDAADAPIAPPAPIPEQDAAPAQPPAQAFAQPAAASTPVTTAQPDPNPPPLPVRSGPASFADIVARAETRLDPEDFRMMANLAGGVRGTVRESFCLSTSDANHEAFNCPEGSRLAAPDLARYGLMGLGEEPPEFLEDMDRMAFRLAQAGASPTQIQRILVSLSEARREAINTPSVARIMERDVRNRTDHLGIGASVTPESARDPSGEP